MIAWDPALIKELAARRCLIFFGAGASASCTATVGDGVPPNWEGLLKALRSKLPPTHADLPLVDELLATKNYLDAAEIILGGISHAAYVAAMREIFETPRYQESGIHKAILEIDPKIVITTNFDTIYDHYCRSGRAVDGYNIFKYHDPHLVSDLRTPIRCVIKAHGCITHPDRMVLTRSQFFSAKQEAPHFFKVLDALFLTHTILFVGYGLTDPDIQLTLENANIAAPASHKHYFVTESGTHASLKTAAERAYNIQFLEFPAGAFGQLEASLEDLAERVKAHRLENPS